MGQSERGGAPHWKRSIKDDDHTYGSTISGRRRSVIFVEGMRLIVVLLGALVGYDPTWPEPHPYLNQRYTNLPAGRYTFEVRAVGREGATSPTPARFAFSIASRLPARSR